MSEHRVGIGIDVHAFGGPGPIRLGGVDFDAETGLVGHSDADVVAHAIADALLGAAALGDIGDHFPDTDDRWAGADSLEMLTHVTAMLGEDRWTISNVDAVVMCEQPRVSSKRDRMRERLAEALAVGVDRVSVKATTSEGLGFAGRREGIVVQAVASVSR